MVRRWLGAALEWCDACADRLGGWRWNPLYQSGALAVLCLAVLLITGLYLVFFYRIGSPHESVVNIDAQIFAGRWIRSLHRYAADATLVAAAVHGLRMFCQGRTWGPRLLAWFSGVLLVLLVLVAGWTGYVMVWDTHGQLLASTGARLLDWLPIFSEPLSRTFAGDVPLPGAFFFINLFLHVALPVGLIIVLWVHVARVARPVMMPPRPLLWGFVGLLLVAAVVIPAPVGPAADLLRVPSDVRLNVFYSFWLPPLAGAPAAAGWVFATTALGVLLAVPFLTRPRRSNSPGPPPPSFVSPRLCTACEQCYVDCPYDAIRMVDRSDDRPGQVALVDPAACVSCGICAGSCAPMGVGPPGRTGRDQLSRVREFAASELAGYGGIVLVACGRCAGARSGDRFAQPVFPVSCVGNLHSSVVEYLVRHGVSGVLVVSCPPRDCVGREGPKWLIERLFQGREAELKERVDRRRVRVVYAAPRNRWAVASAIAGFSDDLGSLAKPAGEEAIELDAVCEEERRAMTVQSSGRTPDV